MKKSTWISVVVFAGLAVGAYVMVSQKPERGIRRMSFDKVDTAAIDKLVMTGKNPVELKKEGDTWKLSTGREADSASVKRTVESIAKIKSSDLVGTDKAKFADLEVDEEKGTTVKAFAGAKEVASFVVGKSAAGGTNIRVGDEVFRVAGVSQVLYSKAASGWIERRIFNDKMDDVTRVDVQLAGQKPYAVVKKDNAWVLEDPSVLPKGFRFDGDQARSLVSALSNMRAKDFEEADPGQDKTGLATGSVISYRVEPKAEAPKTEEGAEPAKDKPAEAPLVAPAPATRTFRFGKVKEGGTDVFVQAEGKPDVFTLAEGSVKSMLKAPTDFRDLKVMAFDRTKAKELTVTDGKVKLQFAKKDNVWSIVKSSEPTPEGFEFDPGVVDRRVGMLANTRAMKLADPSQVGSAALGAAQVTVTLEDGKRATLNFGKEIKDDNKDVVFARGNADGETYLLPKYSRTSLTGGIATFKKQADMGGGGGFGNLDPKALSSLPPDVRESLMKQMQQKQREQDIMKQLQTKAPGKTN